MVKGFDTNLNGKTVVITGSTHPHTRNQVRQAVIACGGHIVGSVTSKVDFVLVGSEPDSKYDKAQKLSIDIIHIKVFMQMYKDDQFEALKPQETLSTDYMLPAPAHVHSFEPKTPVFMYHFKTTLMVDLSMGDENMALKRDVPNPQYQRILHTHGFINIDCQPTDEDQVAAFEHCIFERARVCAVEKFGVAQVVVDHAVIIIDSINLVGSK